MRFEKADATTEFGRAIAAWECGHARDAVFTFLRLLTGKAIATDITTGEISAAAAMLRAMAAEIEALATETTDNEDSPT